MINNLPDIERCDKISEPARLLWTRLGPMNLQYLIEEQLLSIDKSNEEFTPVQHEIEYEEVYLYYG